jgi:tRNA(fMet)-specific endonuclease VapC
MLLLDTNIISQLVRKNPEVLRRYALALEQPDALGLSAVSFYELKRGAFAPEFSRLRPALETLLEDLELLIPDFHAYTLASEIWWDLKQKGMLLEDNDIMIAATAMSFDATLISDNSRHFERIKNLKLENWVERKS